jgi:hypothetical protein
VTIAREQALQWAKEAGLWNDWYAEMWKKENAPRMEAFAALVEQHVRAELVKAQPQQELQAAQTTHWEGCEQSHPECAAKIAAAIRAQNEGEKP